LGRPASPSVLSTARCSNPRLVHRRLEGIGTLRPSDRKVTEHEDFERIQLHGWQESGSGPTSPLEVGQSATALPGYFRRRFSPRSQWRRRSQRQGSGRCSRSWCGLRVAGRPSSCRFAGRSASPWSCAAIACRISEDRGRGQQSTRRPVARTVW